MGQSVQLGKTRDKIIMPTFTRASLGVSVNTDTNTNRVMAIVTTRFDIAEVL